MKELFFRFVVGDYGIYHKVDLDCPRGDSRREGKPDGSWLPKEGPNFSGAISFWTYTGLKKYVDCGLMAWHDLVTEGDVYVLICERPSHILHEDEYQILCNKEDVEIKEKLVLAEFMQRYEPL